MTDSEVMLLDSSAWLLYFFRQSDRMRALIEGDAVLLSSSVSLFEIKKRLLKGSYSRNEITEALGFVKTRSMVIDVDAKTCEAAADISEKHKLAAVDSIIYATSGTCNAKLVTADRDFKNLQGVVMV
ncbi:PIN domain-containing protein [Candidatus Woesearchaeota archaeon]|nr:PIN domain-containing protein [Candidatus Woesearchaeota archaeon]